MVSQQLEHRRPGPVPQRLASWLCGVFSVASLVVSSGCTAMVDSSAEQCRSDADCTARGGAFVGTKCSARNVCEVSACTSTAECNQLLGVASYCRPDTRECVKLLSEQCTAVAPAGALESDDVVLVGFMAPLTDADAGYGTPLAEGATLALSEMVRNEAALPAVDGVGARTLAMLVCEHGEAPADTARHLVDTVGVQAIIGPAFSSPTIAVFRDVAQPKGVLVLSASATSPVITEVNDGGLLWRTAPSDEWQAEALKWVLVEIEDHLESTGVVAPGEANIVLTQKGEAAGSGLVYSATNTNTKIEGAELPPNMDPDRTLPYGDPEQNWANVHRELMREPPDIVVALGTDEFVRELLPLIEENWERLAGEKARPWYLLPEGDRTDKLLEYATAHPELSQRVIGTAPGARRYRGPDNRSPGFPGFASRFRSEYDRDPGNLSEFAYDAVYLLAYAIANTGSAYPKGTEIANALSLMACKSPGSRLLSADPIGAVRAMSTAAAAGPTGCLDFDGVSGPLDFDVTTGEARSDMGLWCLRRESNEAAFEPLLGAYYSTETYSLDESAWSIDLSTPDWCQVGTGGD